MVSIQRLVLPFILVATAGVAPAQVNVLTAHNDFSRTGQNTQETILTPANVNSNQFGKLFTQPVNGAIWAQPLYVAGVSIPGSGTHNVVYVATFNDSVYAFDADTNGGANANPLWQVSLLTNTTPAGTYVSNSGVQGTPVIDLPNKTMYLVSSEIQGNTYVYRLHALDITTGAEKLGGPVQISATVSGGGSGSSGGNLTFNGEFQYQRPGLVLLNGVVYFGFGAVYDNGAWHGWLFSYNATTLQQIDAFCTTPNGTGGGIWMAGMALAAEVNNPAKPYGRMFFATGNGTYSASTPYTRSMSYSMSLLDLDLTGGKFTVEDEFTPYDQALLDGQDGDLGSGGPVLLPTQTLASGKILNPVVQVGKSGMIYILDRDNNNDGSNNAATEYAPAGLGGYNTAGDKVVQEVQTPESGTNNWGLGIWGSPTYWNNHIYFGGTDYVGGGNSYTMYSFVNGVLSANPTSETAQIFPYPAPTGSISANGATNGIVWIEDYNAFSGGGDVLFAYDATNLANLLYSSNTNLARDNPGTSVRETVPTVANGKVYLGTASQLDVFGLLAGETPAPSPTIGPATKTFSGSQTITITDAIAGATIYYTTNGAAPTANSTLYSGPFTIASTETITAIASIPGYLQSAPVSTTYTALTSAANPVFSLAAGSYSGTQTLTITDSSTGAVIHFTFDGTTPTTASEIYTQPLSIPVSETIQAIAVTPGLSNSSVVSAAYTISPPYAIYFPLGFANVLATGQMQFNGSTDLDDYRLQLTNGGKEQAGSAFFTTPVNIQAFTTDFTFQLSNPVGDGMTFVIQNTGPTALGVGASDLGYAGISNSVAIKFDFYNSSGQGNDSTGLYIGGVAPTLPSIDLTNTGINLRSGDYMNVHMTYDGTVLNMTITDAITLATWSHAFVVHIPLHVGGNTAYVGFTGGTGSNSSSQKLTYWSFVSGKPAAPNFPTGFDTGAGLALNGSAALNAAATGLELTSGTTYQAASAYYPTPVNIDTFSTAFDFTIAPGSNSSLGNGFTFVIQNAGRTAIGCNGGCLGFTTIQTSVAIKFDVYNGDGEGNDSTGVYIDGALPTVPAINLIPTGVILGSGDNIHANVTYNGTTLTWTLTDTTLASQPSTTNSVTINIPDLVGGNAAYIGFTAGSGGSTAVQTIWDWTYTP